MSQSQARLFEKWLEAGDDRTFGEWLAYRRHCVIQERQQRQCLARLAEVSSVGRAFPVSGHPSTWEHQALAQLQAGMQQSPYGAQRPYSGGLLGNALGGLFR
jgi:hypothetical protein